MRADRLVSMVLLLRQRGRLSAATLAEELEVSTRTVLRDIEALSAAGVPVYAERGRHGGFELLPGFRTELTGLTHDEALALLIAGSRRGAQAFGLGSALASAMLKVTDALPDFYRDAASGAAERLLVDPEIDLLARRLEPEDAPDAAMTAIRRAVLDGRRVRIRYTAVDRGPAWIVVEPIGLVTVRGQGYLLAVRSGSDRTYRLSRVSAAEVLDEAAERPERVDLDALWRERSTQFRAGGEQVVVRVRVAPAALKALVATALHVTEVVGVGEVGGASEVAGGRAEAYDGEAHLLLDVAFQDARHAEWATWQLGDDGAVLEPAWLRATLRERATSFARRHADD